MKIKILKHGDPEKYKEGSLSWHQSLDFAYFSVGDVITIKELIEECKAPPKDYTDLSQVINDGLIEIIKE